MHALCRYLPKLESLTVLDCTLASPGDADHAFAALALTSPRKARIELRMWDVDAAGIRSTAESFGERPLPGQPGFDAWCLTDHAARNAYSRDREAQKALETTLTKFTM